jgi:hypothetical protein
MIVVPSTYRRKICALDSPRTSRSVRRVLSPCDIVRNSPNLVEKEEFSEVRSSKIEGVSTICGIGVGLGGVCRRSK